MLQEIHGISFHPFILEDERQFGTRIIVISSVRDSNQNLNENPPLITKVSEKATDLEHHETGLTSSSHSTQIGRR